MEETNEISLQEIFMILWNKVWVIILCTLIGGVAAFGISAFVLDPTYTSRVSMYVNSNTERENTIARKMLTASAVNGTEIFEVKVTTKDADEAAVIANTIAAVAPEEIIRVVKAGSVELIDEAVPATSPSSPNVLLNTIIGLMLGGVLSVLGVLVAEMLDNRIKTEDDLKKGYDFPILGTIPDLEDAATRIK